MLLLGRGPLLRRGPEDQQATDELFGLHQGCCRPVSPSAEEPFLNLKTPLKKGQRPVFCVRHASAISNAPRPSFYLCRSLLNLGGIGCVDATY
jgi:hypothetical protein